MEEHNMMKKIGLVLLAVIAIILVIAATKPNEFTVTRTVTIKAPPEKIYPLVADFHNWPAWSPWEKLDPNMKRTLSGAAMGPGAAYAWNGDSNVGSGRMEIIAATAPSNVDINLDFIRPFESNNHTRFDFKPVGDGTLVTWTMKGPMPFMSKLMTVFVSIDEMVGRDFEKGLAQMKAAAEH
jgi:hypothetical protein